MKTWLFGVCRRQAHNTLRRRDMMLGAEGHLDVLQTTDPGSEEALLAGVRLQELADGLERLSTVHREVLVLFFFHGLSYEETAEVAGVPVGTVKSRLNNAKSALRSLLQKERER